MDIDANPAAKRITAPKFDWRVLELSIFIAAMYAFSSLVPQVADLFSLDSTLVMSRPWTLITYIFIHGSFGHLSSNLFSLLIFGFILEKVAGSRNFALVFFLSGIVAGLAGLPFYGIAIGASGAIFGIIGALAVIRPKMVIPAFGIPIPMIVAAALWLMADVGGIFYPDSIGHIGHIAGLGFGIVIGFLLRPAYKLAPQHTGEKVSLDEDYFRWWEDTYLRRPKKVWRKMRRDRTKGNVS